MRGVRCVTKRNQLLRGNMGKDNERFKDWNDSVLNDRWLTKTEKEPGMQFRMSKMSEQFSLIILAIWNQPLYIHTLSIGFACSMWPSFYISDAAGLEVGDNIVEVNSVSFECIASSSAVKVLTGSDHLKLVIRRIGKIPGFKSSKEKTSWYVYVR